MNTDSLLNTGDHETFAVSEKRCSDLFASLGPTFSACTPENHPIIFTTDEDYKAGVCILAVCMLQFPALRLYTFQLMSNHIHLVASGPEDEILAAFQMFRERLQKYFEGAGKYVNLTDFKLKTVPVKDLDYMRNAIAYTNRNGFVVHPEVTPFSYKWGGNAFFFQPLLRYCTRKIAVPFKSVELRAILHNKLGDNVKNLLNINGFALATSFCDIATAEAVFRNARHYFYSLYKNVEVYAEFAQSIGECVYYTDDDLFAVAKSLAESDYGVKNLQLLDAKSKMLLAAQLHTRYNASRKQLQRFLKLPAEVLTPITGE